MKNNWMVDLSYYFITLLVMIAGFAGIYLGTRVYHQENLVELGLWLVVISIIAFLAKNAYYMVESTNTNGGKYRLV